MHTPLQPSQPLPELDLFSLFIYETRFWRDIYGIVCCSVTVAVLTEDKSLLRATTQADLKVRLWL